MRRVFLLLLFSLLAFNSRLWAQTDLESSMVSTQFDTTGFPQWGKDLRRAEIVAFGSFPFAYFFVNFGVDVYRASNHNWDRRYAPWPFDGPGYVDKTKDERIMTIGMAAGTAVLIAVIDYAIVRYKRSAREKEIRSLPPGTPIIIRTPLHGEDAPAPGGGPEISGEALSSDVSENGSP